ncbi:MAG: class I SAM-dependent methyltransferase [bacterium]
MSPALLETPDIKSLRGSPVRPPGETQPYEQFGNVHARNDLQACVEIPLMLRALRLPRGGRILEIGCGRGVALPVLSERLAPSSLTGIDIDVTLLDQAELRMRAAGVRATLVEADVRALPFEASSFDLIIDFGTCYHVSGGRSGSRDALGEIARVLRTNGLFVHETPVAQHLAHPVRSFGRSLPWQSCPSLSPERAALLWAMRRKRARWERS